MCSVPPGIPRRSALLVSCLVAPWWVAAAAALPATLAHKVEPRLLHASTAAPLDSVTAWIEFVDKGEQGPGDLARRLALAEASLSPRSRARRERAHVHPLVDYLDLPLEPAYLQALRDRGLRPYGASRWFNRVAVRAPGGVVAALAELPSVGHIRAVDVLRRSSDPASASPEWAAPSRATGVATVDYGLLASPIAQLNLPTVHDSGYTGTGILIGVLDEGFNYFDKHEALRDHVIPTAYQHDFYRGLETAQDTTDPTMVHGTWVLGVIAGRKFGTYVGSAYGADFALGRTEVRSFERQVEMVYWGMGVEWADSLGVDVINCSLGYTTFDPPDTSYTYADMDGHTTIITRAAEIAASKGILVVAAVGNDGDDVWHYLSAPSDADSLIAVGAVDASGAPASFSSYGPSYDGRIKPDLAAAGYQVWTCGTSGATNLYSLRDGTSFASPLIAGAAACLLQARPAWSPHDVIVALRAVAARKSAPDDRVGYGIPNVFRALDTTTVRPPAVTRLTLTASAANPVRFAHGPGRFSLAVPASLCNAAGSIRVRDALGRRVRDLWAGVVSCPALPLTWDGRDDDGRAVPTGLYLVDARVGSERVTLRLVGLR